MRGDKMKKQYLAIGIGKFNDSKDAIKVFMAEGQENARHHIINHFDCSLEWTFTESSNYIKGGK
tara:strand:- start:531 stop:722 length:192 start_codon:yes stop_codon:yes gene_type:complete